MKLKRQITEEDLRHKGYPFECLNCGNKPVPEVVIKNKCRCEICGDTVIAYTFDTAEYSLKAEGKTKVNWVKGTPPQDDKTYLLKFHGNIICSGRYRTGKNFGEQQPHRKEWRCDCCGRFSTPIEWSLLND